MTITIKSGSSSDVTQTRPTSNVFKAVEMIEQSITEFLSNKDTEKKMLYELAAKAKGSSNMFPQDHGVVLRKYDGVNKWCRVIDLPRREDDPNKWSQDLKTLQWLQDLKALQRNNCTIELFDDISRTAPYVFIAGSKKKEVQEISKKVKEIEKKYSAAKKDSSASTAGSDGSDGDKWREDYKSSSIIAPHGKDKGKPYFWCPDHRHGKGLYMPSNAPDGKTPAHDHAQWKARKDQYNEARKDKKRQRDDSSAASTTASKPKLSVNRTKKSRKEKQVQFLVTERNMDQRAAAEFLSKLSDYSSDGESKA